MGNLAVFLLLRLFGFLAGFETSDTCLQNCQGFIATFHQLEPREPTPMRSKWLFLDIQLHEGWCACVRVITHHVPHKWRTRNVSGGTGRIMEAEGTAYEVSPLKRNSVMSLFKPGLKSTLQEDCKVKHFEPDVASFY